jgi:hypothetical protein
VLDVNPRVADDDRSAAADTLCGALLEAVTRFIRSRRVV